MAKRDKRGSTSPKSKALRAKKVSRTPAKSVELGRASRAERQARTAASSANRPSGTGTVSQPAASVPPRPASVSTQVIGTARRNRTPPPSPIPGELEEIPLYPRPARRRGGGAPFTIPRDVDVSGRAIRTPLPPPIPGEMEEIGLGTRPTRKSQRAQSLQEKGERFQHIQEFLDNPSLIDLRGKELDTSSTPEEIEARTGEVRYQIEVLRSLLTVLTEELSALERARPLLIADQAQMAQS